jgi:hypothetical protein
MYDPSRLESPAMYMGGDMFPHDTSVRMHLVELTVDGWQPTGGSFLGLAKALPEKAALSLAAADEPELEPRYFFNIMPGEASKADQALRAAVGGHPRRLSKVPFMLAHNHYPNGQGPFERLDIIAAYVATGQSEELNTDKLAAVPFDAEAKLPRRPISVLLSVPLGELATGAR